MFNSYWYHNLTKPALSVPNNVFAPVWTILYLMILLSLFFYIRSPLKNKKDGYIFFITQLALNLLWSPIFFGLHNIALALAVIIMLDIFTILTITEFYSASKLSGILLVPYLVWILFATYLNVGYLVLNY